MDREARIAASRDGRIGIIELARPALFNCLSVQGYDEILAALRDFEADPAIRVVLVRAQAKLEKPLVTLVGIRGGALIISTIADVTFFGKDQTGRDATVTGSISVNFAESFCNFRTRKW